MSQRLPPSHTPTPGFVGQLMATVAGLILVFSFFMIGFFVFSLLLALGVVFWSIFVLRRWWLGRGKPAEVKARAKRSGGDTLEGEFRVVGKRPGRDDPADRGD